MISTRSRFCFFPSRLCHRLNKQHSDILTRIKTHPEIYFYVYSCWLSCKAKSRQRPFGLKNFVVIMIYIIGKRTLCPGSKFVIK